MIGGNAMLTIWFWLSVIFFITAMVVLWKWYRPEDMSQDVSED
ncbi:hypothetical protein [Calderihabitans maritimus]|uniref:Uncharacterized protein n=1 Tax=Calderihabitans maritimus TaxID=1246530 RepID=A0A1Z5HRK8_9FIRM|nr:hypothetical protein [Calderihabitans maritimus]GAW92162.1 hypothetical protein KKC1_13210 [Calderihabitans maritimus]